MQNRNSAKPPFSKTAPLRLCETASSQKNPYLSNQPTNIKYKNRNMYQFYFEKLDVWRSARILATAVYEKTKVFPISEQFGITSQIRRAATSISANVAEGMSRNTDKDKAKFINQAYGSAIEVINFLIIANDLHILSSPDYIELREQVEKITNQSNALSKKLRIP